MPAGRIARIASALAVVALLALPQSPAGADGCIAALTDRCEAWASTYDGPAGHDDSAEAIAVSPAGDRLFVGGVRTVGTGVPFSGSSDDVDYGVIAYETGTGRELWAAGYAGPGDPASGSRDDYLLDLEPSADGSTVFVTGYSRDGRGPVDYDWATVAIDAATGKRLWVARHNAGGGAWDLTWDLAVGTVTAPDDTQVEMVFVAGYASLDGGGQSGSTVAYDAATGAKLWEATTNPGPALRSVAFTPASEPGGTPLVHAAGGGVVLTYDARSGEELWRSGFGVAEDKPAYAWSVVAGGGGLYVTGWGATVFDLEQGIELDAVTAAYDARSGERLWQTAYAGPDGTDDFFWDVALSPGGDRVYATGRSSAMASTAVTAAYDAATGSQVWAARYSGLTGANAVSDAVAVHPGGGEVYVAASSPFTTLAFDAQTGLQRWEARYTPPGATDYAYRIAPSADGSRLFVAGARHGPGASGELGLDFLTVAYDV